MYDGNYVIASKARRPWRKQLNLLTAYAYFYNPLRLLSDLIRQKTKVGLRPAGMQILGMMGLCLTIYRTSGWAVRLLVSRGKRRMVVPGSPVPMRSPDPVSVPGR